MFVLVDGIVAKISVIIECVKFIVFFLCLVWQNGAVAIT